MAANVFALGHRCEHRKYPPTRMAAFSEIPPRQVAGSFIYSLHDEARQIPSPNPTNAVGGSFIYSLHDQARQIRSPNPTNAVGGSFIYSLHDEARQDPFPESHQRSWWIVHIQPTRKGPAAPLVVLFSPRDARERGKGKRESGVRPL